MAFNPPVILSIAGSDCTAGAGIQADLKTSEALGVYCTTALTAVTAQSPFRVKGILSVGEEMLRNQLNCIAETVLPSAVKTGMLPDAASARVAADFIKSNNITNVVVDPVLVATSGGRLTDDSDSTISGMVKWLFPMASIITPNIPEMRSLLDYAGIETEDITDNSAVDSLMQKYNINAILLKGGHEDSDYCIDRIYLRNANKPESVIVKPLTSQRIDTSNMHGTGCTLSTAIACGLAKGFNLEEAVTVAKAYVTGALERAAGSTLFPKNGPLCHKLNR